MVPGAHVAGRALIARHGREQLPGTGRVALDLGDVRQFPDDQAKP
ncbi:hypothetical protein [Saccharothrix yanglingensis]|nr:hypothetical protein [Saccharothrix yanglingensis]